MIRGIIWTSDNGVVIEFSRPRVLIRRTVRGQWNRLIHPFAIETASSPEHEACSGVNHVVVNIDRAGILVLLISTRSIHRWTSSKTKIVMKVNMVQGTDHLPSIVPSVLECSVMNLYFMCNRCQYT